MANRFFKKATSKSLKEEHRVNWKIANFSEIRDSKEALEAQIHRFEMGSSINLPIKLKCYLTCNRVQGRMWINPNVDLEEKPSGNVSRLFATLQVEINEGSVFHSETTPLSNISKDSMRYSPLIPQIHLPFEAEFRNYVNADGSLYLSLIVNLYHFKYVPLIALGPCSTLLYGIKCDFEQKSREKLQQDMSKICKNPDTLSQDLAMHKVVSSDNKEFFVNPEILRVRCPVLYSMLAEDTSSVLTFTDIPGQHLETLVAFVHTAKLPQSFNVSAETNGELISIAKKFELMDLVNFLEESRKFSGWKPTVTT